MGPFAKTSRQLDHEIADHQQREHLRGRIQRLLDKWQPILGVKVREFHVKKMAAFGSLNPGDRRLWVSQALATMAPADLEYVVVHELMHLLIDEGPRGSGHHESFYTLMDRHLPGWRRRHARLRSDEGVVARKLPRLDRP